MNKAVSAVLSVAMMGVILTACAENNKEAVPAASGSASSSSEASSSGATASSAGETGSVYPLKTDVTLSQWIEADPSLLALKPNYAEFPLYQELVNRTGVNIKYIHPATNQAKEQLNVMFASGDYADIMEWRWMENYPGGPEKAMEDGNILKLNDLIDQYAPNLKVYLQEHPDVDKQIKTDSGTYYGFPFVRGDDSLKVFQGPILRKDWLDELGLQVPTTIDEWHTVLQAFKEKKGAEAPLTFASQPRLLDVIQGGGGFVGAYGVGYSFYLQDGQVKYGPNESGFKDFLATFHQWYAEGLIDVDVATVDSKILTEKMTSGKSGATIANAGGGLGNWMSAMKEKDPSYDLVGAPYPVLNKGDTPMMGQKDFSAPYGGYFAISPKSEHPEIAVQYLDYGFSEEGQMLYNFGIEGVSYTMKDGYPTYTDAVMSNFSQNYGQYTRATNGPTVQDKRYYEQFASLPQQTEAIQQWMKTDADNHVIPPVSPTAEESTEMAKIMNEVQTLVDETVIKVIIGRESIDDFDKFQQKLKSLKIDRAIEIKQAAYDRYMSR
ncbi:extracellular solute-binding protein [Cohnella fermenti]|uniref:Extracellular solute-binding protein n=2 Tax=Cohnella fermenti TaxID=2565925 RepID=A0A4S4BW33_9BACL|nr:extracellular solute-binding protein [Cohnella fermenti]